ncbi:CheW protein [Desulfocurvibacter africanus PCS]|uniref:CheW protein n=1 Tax=Desulfocurvibacter africanus PCS TaxID=1262666 RepID=M5PNV7_DESAF|nr:chemotaxis protein CheW [Desulfocurvibacter africanus]EMG35892.1 CheW protein [Desulfocurvibacter africanus PCS]
MAKPTRYVLFSLDSHRFAVPLRDVLSAERAAWVTSLPGAPEVILGAVDIGGRMAPVVDLRRRFGLPPRELRVSDSFLLVRASGRLLALLVDAVEGVREAMASRITLAGEIWPGLEYLDGVARLEDEIVLIHDLARLLSLEEAQALDEAASGLRREQADA